jgi:ferredoxin
MVLGDWVKSRGFSIIAGHSLKTPSNFPPSIADGWNNTDDPDDEQIKTFDSFIAELDALLFAIAGGGDAGEARITIDKVNMELPYAPRTQAREDMGSKFVDHALCIKCGRCISICPYNAIEMKNWPDFDMDRCYGCWACFNRCPSKAIYTDKYRGSGHYPEANEYLKIKLKVQL